MTAQNQTVTLWKGDSLVITIPVKDADDNFVDLNGATARWWMGKSVNATGADIYIQKQISDGLDIERIDSEEWDIIITIDPVDTESLTAGTYYHEVELVDADGNISTVTVGKFVLKPTLIPDEL